MYVYTRCNVGEKRPKSSFLCKLPRARRLQSKSRHLLHRYRESGKRVCCLINKGKMMMWRFVSSGRHSLRRRPRGGIILLRRKKAAGAGRSVFAYSNPHLSTDPNRTPLYFGHGFLALNYLAARQSHANALPSSNHIPERQECQNPYLNFPLTDCDCVYYRYE